MFYEIEDYKKKKNSISYICLYSLAKFREKGSALLTASAVFLISSKALCLKVFWFSKDDPTGHSERKKVDEADRRRNMKTISKSGQEWILPAQLGS